MGLDMYLNGRMSLYDSKEKSGDFVVRSKELELGYWRKHPDLHGYIVKNYAKGVDDCKPIKLDIEALEDILEAVKENNLPLTEGFFFGSSDDHKNKESVVILKAAIKWLKEKETDVYKSVSYVASW